MSTRILKSLALSASAAVVVLAFAGVASAAPADTTRIRECSPDGDTGNTICYTIHAVDHTIEAKSGKTQSVETGSMLIEYFAPDGALLWDDKTQWHSNIIEADGAYRVYHDQVRVKYTVDDETCRNVANTTFANGEVRHLGPKWEWVCK